MLGTLDFTGSEQWAPLNSPKSTALIFLSNTFPRLYINASEYTNKLFITY